MNDTPERLRPNRIGGIDDPVNIKIMEVEPWIREHRAQPVTSALTLEPSTHLYHSEGLYSETIFGQVGSPERLQQFGYIELNTPIFNPKIFKLILKLGGLYKDIMSGAAYATFDPIARDFIRVIGDPLDTPDADTGFSFFLRHFPDLVFRTTDSSKRDERIEVIEQYRADALQTKYLVEPAGLRDISNDTSGRLVQDEINKLYIALLLYTRSIPTRSNSPLYDTVRYQIQSKGQEIYEYIENFLDGKRGFIQGSFARRKVALGTRNVIAAATNIASHPEDPKLLKADDAMVGVYQTIKGMQPHTKHAYATLISHPIFKADGSTQIALTDLKTLKLVYTDISSTTRNAWVSSDGVDKMLNSFRNLDLRRKPMLIPDSDGKLYALLLVYDEGDTIALCRSIDDLEARFPRKVDKTKLRPITYIELFYIIAEIISVGKHVVVTRYPVIEQGSAYVARPHVVSTTPSRQVELLDLLSPEGLSMTLRHYPVTGASFMDAMMVHASKLAALGGDHDGDKMSCEYVLTRDGNQECADYLASPRSIVNTDMRFITGGGIYLTDLLLHGLTHR